MNNKFIKPFKTFEANSENFYSHFWIEELSEKIGKCSVDKMKNITPLYGGGNYVFIGYKVEVTSHKIVSSIILEGIAINGVFVNPSIIIYQGDYALVHASLQVTYSVKDKIEDNIKMVIEAAINKINTLN